MKQNILYVEKDEEEHVQLHRVLKDAGYDIFVASSGREAYLILLIFDLPDIDAFDLARQMRRPHGALGYRPIIAATP